MLEGKILGIFASLDYESFSVTEICKLTNSKKTDVKLIISNLVKADKLLEVKNKFKLNK